MSCSADMMETAVITAYMSCEAQSLLRGLLQREPPKRLGYGPTGSDDVMRHPFFKPLKWSKLLKREMPSPFRPSVQNSHSVENFDRIWTDLDPEDSPCGTPPGDDITTFQASPLTPNIPGSLCL